LIVFVVLKFEGRNKLLNRGLYGSV